MRWYCASRCSRWHTGLYLCNHCSWCDRHQHRCYHRIMCWHLHCDRDRCQQLYRNFYFYDYRTKCINCHISIPPHPYHVYQVVMVQLLQSLQVVQPLMLTASVVVQQLMHQATLPTYVLPLYIRLR